MALPIESIVDFWASGQVQDTRGRWVHMDDLASLENVTNENFNLDYPVSPYIGDIINSPVIILNLNGGFHEERTPAEFSTEGAHENLLHRVADPTNANWADIPDYYHDANYGSGILDSRFVAINACAYRSKNLKNDDSRKIARSLPSVRFHQRWLRESILPLAHAGSRLVIAHRWGLWNIPKTSGPQSGVHRDLRCRAFPDIDNELLNLAITFAKG